ncbi:dihydrodipicolinate synthase family protein [Streptomyces sp. NPDC020807]|uniref:dihydrodipicolinate synthase family protein n=1 Tax=Streptomyces sp. NPDC020807 TaxID=3155119 RepID=UPI0033D32503
MNQGVIAALVTPFSETGEVSERAVAGLLDTLRPHVDGLLPNLSTGEGRLLTDAQWEAMLRATVTHADGLPVLAGVLRPTTEQVLERARVAVELGAHALVATSPYGPDVTQDEIYEHFARLSADGGLPVIVYHGTEVSGNAADFDTLLRICELPGVVGVKDSSGSSAFTRRLVEAEPGAAVLAGLEHLLLESGPVDGYVVALANVEPELCADLFAGRLDDPATPLDAACERYGLEKDDWYRWVKTALYERGILENDRTVDAAQVHRPEGAGNPSAGNSSAGNSSAGSSRHRELFRLNRELQDSRLLARIEEIEGDWIVPLVASLDASGDPVPDRAAWQDLLDGLLAEEREGGPAGAYLADEASREEFALVVREFALDGLTEAQNFFPAVPRLPIKAQMAVMRVLIDEFGCGNLQQAHSQLYRLLLAELELPQEPEEFLDTTGDETFAFLNVFYWLTQRAPHVEYFLGGLAYLEASIPDAFVPQARACERLGIRHGRYYTEHLHIDTFHMQEMQLAIKECEAAGSLDPARLWTGARLVSGLIGAAFDAAVDRARSLAGGGHPVGATA